MVLKISIIGEEQNTFAVAVQSADGINIFYRDVALKRVDVTRKLTQHTIRLVEDEITQRTPYH